MLVAISLLLHTQQEREKKRTKRANRYRVVLFRDDVIRVSSIVHISIVK
jgi:ATP-dependent Clp protease adapter protein ClpS